MYTVAIKLKSSISYLQLVLKENKKMLYIFKILHFCIFEQNCAFVYNNNIVLLVFASFSSCIHVPLLKMKLVDFICNTDVSPVVSSFFSIILQVII